MEKPALNVREFLDPENAPEYAHKLAVAHFRTNQKRDEVQELLQRIQLAERKLRRNEQLMAKGKQYMKAYEAKRDVQHLHEYLRWVKVQEEAQAKQQVAEDIQRERARKTQMKTQRQEMAAIRVMEAGKARDQLNRTTQLHDTLVREVHDQHRTEAKELREQALYNRSTLRNTRAKELVHRNTAHAKEHEELIKLIAVRKAEHRASRPPSAAVQRRAGSTPCRPPRAPPSCEPDAAERAEIKHLMEEMERAQMRLRESRKEFELAMLKTSDVVKNLGPKHAASPRSPATYPSTL